MRVILESPYAGDVERNLEYADMAMLHSLKKGEAPYLSHLLYTRVLDDTDPEQRAWGIGAAQNWYAAAHKVVVYEDYGHSRGMIAGIKLAKELDIPIEYRRILPHVSD